MAHTVLDNEDGPPTDLSIFETIACQIREKNATRNAKGFFEHKVVATVTIEVNGSVMWLKLSRAVTDKIHTGDYLIDVVASMSDGTHESLLDPEPVKVVNRPTLPEATSEESVVVPNFVDIFQTALND